MAKFIQFKEDRNWTPERNVRIQKSLVDYGFISLLPNEPYRQLIDKYRVFNDVIGVDTQTYNGLPDFNVLYLSTANISINTFGSTQSIIDKGSGNGSFTIRPVYTFTGCQELQFEYTVTSTEDITLEYLIRDTDNSNLYYTDTVNLTAGVSLTMTTPLLPITSDNIQFTFTTNDIAPLSLTFDQFDITTNCDIVSDVPNLKIVKCNNQEINADIEVKNIGDYLALDFTVLEDYTGDILRFTDCQGWYSNYFEVSSENDCDTSMIHYLNEGGNCLCETTPNLYQYIRVKLRFLRYESANELVEDFQLATNNLVTTTKIRKFVRWQLKSDSLVSCCFNEISEFSKIYFNNTRQVISGGYEIPELIGSTNCGISEFLSDEREDDILTDIQTTEEYCIENGL